MAKLHPKTKAIVPRGVSPFAKRRNGKAYMRLKVAALPKYVTVNGAKPFDFIIRVITPRYRSRAISRRIIQPGTMSRIKKTIKICGITFSLDRDICFRKNLADRLAALKATLNLWRTRSLTLEGKILITKSLALSQILYPLQMVHVPEDFLRQVESCIYKFIWNRKETDPNPRPNQAQYP